MSRFSTKVLAIHAHPDDTEIFCSGTLRLLQDQGYSVTIATMTAGGMGGIGSTEGETITTREGEAQKAAEQLNADYVCLGGRDGFLYDTEDLRLRTLNLIRREEAGVLMTHLPFDYHADHRTTANIVEVAAMLSTLPNAPVDSAPLAITPLLYHTAPLGSTDPLGEAITPPHFYVDVGPVIDAKMAMLAQHESQMELMRVMHKMDDFFGECKKASEAWGAECGCTYAEAFWQHRGGGFQKDPVLQEILASHLRERTS